MVLLLDHGTTLHCDSTGAAAALLLRRCSRAVPPSLPPSLSFSLPFCLLLWGVAPAAARRRGWLPRLPAAAPFALRPRGASLSSFGAWGTPAGPLFPPHHTSTQTLDPHRPAPPPPAPPYPPPPPAFHVLSPFAHTSPYIHSPAAAAATTTHIPHTHSPAAAAAATTTHVPHTHSPAPDWQVENHEGVSNFDDILAKSDAIMVGAAAGAH